MQQHLRDHMELAESIKLHIEAQNTTMANLENTGEELRCLTRLEEDAKEDLRKTQQSTCAAATSDAYGGMASAEEPLLSGSSPFASAVASQPASTPFASDRPPSSPTTTSADCSMTSRTN